MSKAILVMDMPSCCDECPLCYDSYGEINFCSAQDRSVSDFHIGEVQVWCPLKPVPEKMEGYDSIRYQWGEYEDGWNHCIDYILGD